MAKPQANIFMLDDQVIDMSKTEVIENKQYLADPALRVLADDVINEYDLQLGEAQIDYLLVYPNISKKVAGKCTKCNTLMQHYTGYNFVIQISGEMWDMLDRETRRILMLHELMHVGAQYSVKQREWKYSVVPHDFEDFYRIIKAHGLEWYQTIQSTVGSLYDLDPRDENKVRV